MAAGCSSGEKAEGATASAEQWFELCTQCHGADGLGRREFQAPAIAGLPDWYVEGQLTKFKSGARGTHPDDVSGMRMRPMAIEIDTEADIKAIAALVAKMPAAKPAPLLTGGDKQAGQALYTPCTACHGPKGAGNPLLKSPPINRASDWYLLAQLKKFKEGVRGSDPRDITGAQMAPMAKVLADEQAMRNVVAYVMSLQ
ncbi:MAG: cytochrome c [Proteobacteria bacterium]|nr:cytochrome c [Pseudomonadota bacterium]